jgi:WD40 repeat protein
MSENEPDYDVALSFAGEDRAYAQEVAAALVAAGFRVFYDRYETASLWGKNLYEHLREIYSSRTRFVVILASRHYREKVWARHELASAQARALEERREYILPARFDETEIPGIPSTVAYIDLNEYTPRRFAELVAQKIRSLSQDLVPAEQEISAGSPEWEVGLPVLAAGNADRIRRLVKEIRKASSSITFSPSSRFMAFSSVSGVWLWDHTTDQSWRLSQEESCSRVRFSPEGASLWILAGNKAQEWNLWEREWIRTIPFEPAALGADSMWACSSTISHDCRLAAIELRGKKIGLIDLPAGKLVAQIAPSFRRLTALEFSPDDRLLAVSGGAVFWPREGELAVYRLRGLENVYRSNTHRWFVAATAFSPSGDLLASASADRSVHIVRVGDWKPHCKLEHPIQVRAVAFSPTGELIASGSLGMRKDGEFRVWRVSDGRQLAVHAMPDLREPFTFPAKQNGINDITFTPSGKSIAVATSDSGVTFWGVVS